MPSGCLDKGENKMQDGQEFLHKRNEQFHLLYSWLKSAMPAPFFQLVSLQELFLIADQLINFDLQDSHCQITLPHAAVVLCLDGPKAHEKICRKYEALNFVTMHSFLSLVPLESSGAKLCVTCFLFDKQPPHQIDSKFLEVFPAEKQQFLKDKLKQAEARDLVVSELLRPIEWNREARSSLEFFFACKGPKGGPLVCELLQTLRRHKIGLGGVSLTYVPTENSDTILLLTCELYGEGGAPCWDCTDIEQLNRELACVRYFAMKDLFEKSYESFLAEEGLSLPFLRSVCCFVHELLVHVDPNMYSLDNVKEAFCYWPELGIDLYRLFCFKCNPLGQNLAAHLLLRQQLVELIERQDTGKEHADTRRKTVLMFGLYFVDACLKTNFFLPNKAALSYRLDPYVLERLPERVKLLFSHAPFGLFFIYQRDFFGFHIRFQDLARGGLRTITLPTKEIALEEVPVIFLECYQLAWTQQRKNKDLPEGGSKGIIFLYPPEDREAKLVHLYRAQRIFIESLLVLVNCDENGELKEKAIIDYFTKPEYLYLGPDENMHDVMIDWIADYAKKIGYKPGTAFITSKTKTGINHKWYGVTSHGVNICMQEVLRFLKIDPLTMPFTVKMAGGPDGDVAGNQIRNLYRYYPETAHLTSLIDISGVIYDPQGLSLPLLEELFLGAKPIRFYPPDRLSEGGFLLDMRSEKREGVHILRFLCYRKKEGEVVEEWLSAAEAHQILRTWVHRLPADVFIPAGGRPGSLSASNIADFFDPQGVPTAKTIIEGANLYLTDTARHILEEKGVIIIKDSSANKGGVICSSFEVLTSLSLNDEEYMAHKEQIVGQIMRKIEEYARDEVNLILHELARTGRFPTLISDQISDRIDLFSSQIRNYLEGIQLAQDPNDPLMNSFFEYLLPILSQEFRKQCVKSIPDFHKKAIIAAWIASKVVYHRGLEWSPSIVDVLPFVCQNPAITSCPLT
ncbi:MAG: NAD-glutamate dehydrogenase [Verrucomicrobia bacterium]|nr:NAD-glutamate dehydrogenase [Verrucomicrobiota bacterium]